MDKTSSDTDANVAIDESTTNIALELDGRVKQNDDMIAVLPEAETHTYTEEDENDRLSGLNENGKEGESEICNDGILPPSTSEAESSIDQADSETYPKTPLKSRNVQSSIEDGLRVASTVSFMVVLGISLSRLVHSVLRSLKSGRNRESNNGNEDGEQQGKSTQLQSPEISNDHGNGEQVELAVDTSLQDKSSTKKIPDTSSISSPSQVAENMTPINVQGELQEISPSSTMNTYKSEAELLREIAQTRAHNVILEAEKENLQDDLMDANDMIAMAAEEIRVLKDQIKEVLESQSEADRNLVEEADRKIIELGQHLHDEKERNRRLEDEVKDMLESQNETERKLVKEADSKLFQLEQCLHDEKERNRRLEDCLIEQERQISALSRAIASQQSFSDALDEEHVTDEIEFVSTADGCVTSDDSIDGTKAGPADDAVDEGRNEERNQEVNGGYDTTYVKQIEEDRNQQMPDDTSSVLVKKVSECHKIEYSEIVEDPQEYTETNDGTNTTITEPPDEEVTPKTFSYKDVIVGSHVKSKD